METFPATPESHRVPDSIQVIASGKAEPALTLRVKEGPGSGQASAVHELSKTQAVKAHRVKTLGSGKGAAVMVGF